MNQTPTKISHKNRNIGIAITTVLLLIIALVAGLYFSGNFPVITISTPTPQPTSSPSPTPIPFDYHVELIQPSGSVLQGNSIQVEIGLTYLQGTPENINLLASGEPDGVTCSFNPTTMYANANTNVLGVQVIASTITINVQSSVPTNPYSITITPTADNGKTYPMSFTLSVLSAKIQVSGTITTTGVGTHPTQIQFVNTASSLTYTATVQNGNYYISLPNQQSYNVVCSWQGLLSSSGTFNGGILYVNSGVEVTSITKNFSG